MYIIHVLTLAASRVSDKSNYLRRGIGGKSTTSCNTRCIASDEGMTVVQHYLSVVPGCNNMLDFWIFILFYFVITHEAPLDVEQAAACGSPGEEDGPPRTGNSIDSQGRLMLWGI